VRQKKNASAFFDLLNPNLIQLSPGDAGCSRGSGRLFHSGTRRRRYQSKKFLAVSPGLDLTPKDLVEEIPAEFLLQPALPCGNGSLPKNP
jgi:hypothetical protein